jgi:glutathione S-transferase
VILYGSSFSPFVRKVLAFAAEKEVVLENRPVGIGDPNPDFRVASPFGKMPALVDGDFSLADSSAIVHYLEAKVPDPSLIPSDPQMRGRTIWFEEFADTVLMSCLAKMFFNRVVAPVFLKREGNEELAGIAEREELPPILAYLERTVPAEGFLVGDRISLADIAVASPLANAPYARVAVDPAAYPRTVAFAERILSRPSFAPLLAREQAFLAKVSA